jgi:agmatine/peptidylarginine deiminase
MRKALIRYPLGIPYALIREMDEAMEISCVVSNGSYNAARTAFQSNGVDPNAVDWIIAPSDSYWTRDYGPWFVFDGSGDIHIIDHFYNRPSRPNDNNIPIVCGQHWGIPVHTHDLWTTGGNYMTDGTGLSFSTDLVWDENAGMTHQQIFQRMVDYYGLSAYHVLTDDLVSYIRHIDCWAKILDEETILVKQVANNHPDYARLEQNAALISSLQSANGRPYRVFRVNCQSIGGNDVAGYTNSLVLDRKILVPTFGNQTYDNNALNVYREAAPGYEVIGVSYNGWLTDDALHCRVMGIPDFQMLRVDHAPIVSWDSYEPIPVRAFIDDRSEAGLKSDSLLVYWRAYPTGQIPPSYSALALSPDTPADWYQAFLPAQPSGTTVDYFIHAVDNTGRREGMPRCEPLADYSFQVTLPASGIADGSDATSLRGTASPNPFSANTTFSFALRYEDTARLGVYDTQGRLVRRLLDGRVAAGQHWIEWDARDDAGDAVPQVSYFFRLQAGGLAYTSKAILIH